MLVKEHPVLMLYYFIVSYFRFSLVGPGTPEGNRRVRYCFCFLFFVQERDVDERASSDMGEAGFNEMRVQFTMQGDHDLTAIHYICSMPRGYRSRHRDTHEIMLSVLYLGLGSLVWLHLTLY